MATSSPTKTSTPRLSELARYVVVPEGITATAWPSVRAKCAELGLSFDPWQHGAGQLILAKREDGKYAAGVGGVAMSIPRQVGKTFLLGAIIFALCLLHPNLTVLWTAHRLRTAGETFRSMQSLARRKRIKPFVEKIVLGSGDEEIIFRNGSRIMFGARERGFGRGFSGVDLEVFDEAQILTDNAIDDMVPATNTAPNPLILLTGTPPKPTDPGEVFAARRREALAGESTDALYIEFSADEDAKPGDRSQWRKANPSHPKRTPSEAILRMQKNLTPDSFMREALGVWDPEATQAISPAKWLAVLDPGSRYSGNGHVALGLHVSGDRSTAFLFVAGQRDDTLVHVEMYDPVPTALAERFAAEKAEKHGCTVFVDASSHANSLVPGLEAAGVPVEAISLQKYAQACGMVLDSVTNLNVRHIGQPVVDTAVAAAGVKACGRDAWIWDGPALAPLKALTLALYGYATAPDSDTWGFFE